MVGQGSTQVFEKLQAGDSQLQTPVGSRKKSTLQENRLTSLLFGCETLPSSKSAPQSPTKEMNGYVHKNLFIELENWLQLKNEKTTIQLKNEKTTIQLMELENWLQAATIVVIWWAICYGILLSCLFLVQIRARPLRLLHDLKHLYHGNELAMVKEMQSNSPMTRSLSQLFLALTAPNVSDSKHGHTTLPANYSFDQQPNGIAPNSQHTSRMPLHSEPQSKNCTADESCKNEPKQISNRTDYHITVIKKQLCLKALRDIIKTYGEISLTYWKNYDISCVLELPLPRRHGLPGTTRDEESKLPISTEHDRSRKAFWQRRSLMTSRLRKDKMVLKTNGGCVVNSGSTSVPSCSSLSCDFSLLTARRCHFFRTEIENDVTQCQLTSTMLPASSCGLQHDHEERNLSEPPIRDCEELHHATPVKETPMMMQLTTDFTEEDNAEQAGSESPGVHLRLGLKHGSTLPADADSKTADDQDVLRCLLSVLFSEFHRRGCHDSTGSIFSSTDYLSVYPVPRLLLKRVIGALERLAIAPADEPSSPLHSIELFRLITFAKWPHIGKMSSLRFSSSGFHYVGPSDTVTCHSCRLSLKGWTALVQPLEIHQQKCDGRCQLIGESALLYNLPLTASHVTHLTALRSITPIIVLVPDVAGCYVSERGGVISFLKDPTNAHQNLDRGVFDDARRQQQQQQREELWKFESVRLKSYNGIWRYGHIAQSHELARSGFYYTGPDDRVQCAFCQGALRNWEEGDKPDELHAKHFNYCRFVQGHDVGNVPIPFRSLAEATSTAADDTFNAEGTPSPEGLGIFRSVPKHADFAVESRRLSTFATWSASHNLRAEALAQAGFFFTGSADAVTCFFCDGTVSGWKSDSDPWIEHARRFPTCPYVLQVKGRSIVDQQPTLPTSASGSGVQRTSLAVDPREIRARMDTPAVRIILKMEYPSDLVREVIQRRLSMTGSDYGTSEELLGDMFNFHDEKQRSSNATRDHKAASDMPVVVSEPSATELGSSSYSDSILVATAASAPAFGETRFASTAASDLAHSFVATPRQRPEDENRQLKTQLACKICMDAVVGIIFLPCGHLVSCAACAPALTSCPICRVSIRGTARVTF